VPVPALTRPGWSWWGKDAPSGRSPLRHLSTMAGKMIRAANALMRTRRVSQQVLAIDRDSPWVPFGCTGCILSCGGSLVLLGFVFAVFLYVALSAEAFQNMQLPPVPAGTGAVSGVVTDGSTKRPLRGVVLSLRGGGVARRRTITDSKGRFVFADLPAADGLVLDAMKPGYAAEGLARLRSLLTIPDATLSLRDGEWIPDANFEMYRLGGISGRVIDEQGEPIVNVPVRVLMRIPVAGTMRLAAGPAARTDDRGIYRVAGLASGTYLVAVPSVQSVVPPTTPAATVRGSSPTGPFPPVAGLDIAGWWLAVGQYAVPPPFKTELRIYPPVFFPNARTTTAATAVQLVAGEEKGAIDFTLEPVSGVQVSGRVVGAPEALAGLVVRLVPDGGDSMPLGFETATALVQSDGSFTMVAVPSGRYVLEARTTVSEVSFNGHALTPPVVTSTAGMIHAGDAFSTFDSTAGFATFRTRQTARQGSSFGRLAVTVGSSNLSNLVVIMTRGVRISGRVVREDGAPLTRTMRVHAEPANGDPALAVPSIQIGSNPAGTFVFEGLQPGEYFIRTGAFIKSVEAGGDYTNRPFDTTSGSDISDVVITISDSPATLSGVVRDRQGSVLREAAVILFPVEKALWTRFGLEPQRIRAITYLGTRGYHMNLLPAGEYYAIAVEPSERDRWQDPRFFPAAAPLSTRVTLLWDTPTVQDLTMREVVIK
jgi:Carboxypeptidase regulatory-like domain